jgi:hypothetical protein
VDPKGGSILSQVFAKNIGSQSPTAGIFQFESGIVINEPATLALKSTIEGAVVELIKEGERKHIWDYKYPFPKEKHWYDSKDKNEPTNTETKTNPEPATKMNPVNAKTDAKGNANIPLGLSNKINNNMPIDEKAKQGEMK